MTKLRLAFITFLGAVTAAACQAHTPATTAAAQPSVPAADDCAEAEALRGRIDALVAAGRLDSAARRVDKLDAMLPRCSRLADAALALRRTIAAELGHCAALDKLPQSKELEAAKATCAERAKDKADDLVVAGRSARAAGDAVMAQRSFDRALAALERETGARAELMTAPAPSGPNDAPLSTPAGELTVHGFGGFFARTVPGAALRWTVEAVDVGRVAALRDDGKQMLVQRGKSYELRELPSLAVVGSFMASESLLVAAYNRDGSRLLVSDGLALDLVDTSSGKVITHWAGFGESLGAGFSPAPSFSPNGRHLLAQMKNGTLSVLDTNDGKEVILNLGPLTPVQRTEDGVFAVTCQREGDVLVDIDLDAGRRVPIVASCAGLLFSNEWFQVLGEEARPAGYINLRTGKRAGAEPAIPAAAEKAAPATANAFAATWSIPRAKVYSFSAGGRALDLGELGTFDPKSGSKYPRDERCAARPQCCRRIEMPDDRKATTVSICDGKEKCATLDVGLRPSWVSLSESCDIGLVGRDYYDGTAVAIDMAEKRVIAKIPKRLEQWMTTLGPAPSDGRTRETELHVIADHELSTIDLVTGAEKGTRRLGDDAKITREGVVDRVDNTLQMFDWAGAEKWSHPFDTPPSSVEAANDHVLAGLGREHIAVLEAKTGKLVREVTMLDAQLYGRWAAISTPHGVWLRDLLVEDEPTFFGYVSKKSAWFVRGAGGFGKEENGFKGRAVIVGPEPAQTPVSCRFGKVYTAFDACSGRFSTTSLGEEP